MSYDRYPTQTAARINKNFVRDLCTVRKCYVDPYMTGRYSQALEPFHGSQLPKLTGDPALENSYDPVVALGT